MPDEPAIRARQSPGASGSGPGGLRMYEFDELRELFGDIDGSLELMNMALQSHLAELERRHRALESEIIEARAHPSIDNLQIAEMKRRKLLVKDEIARLQTLIGCN